MGVSMQPWLLVVLLLSLGLGCPTTPPDDDAADDDAGDDDTGDTDGSQPPTDYSVPCPIR